MTNFIQSVFENRFRNAVYLRLGVSYAIAALLWVVGLDWALKFGYGHLPFFGGIVLTKNVVFVVLSAFALWDFATRYLVKEQSRGDSAEDLRLVSGTSRDAFWLVARDKNEDALRLVYANSGFSEIWGSGLDEVRERSSIFNGWIHEGDAHWAEQRVELFFAGKGGSTLDVEFRLKRPDGSTRWVWTKAEMEFDKNGRPVRIAGVSRDLTTRKKTQLALANSEQVFKSLFDLSPDAMALCSLDGSFMKVNNAFVEFAGYDRRELLEMTFQSMTSKGWKREENRIIKEDVLNRGYSDVYEKKCRRKNGSHVLASVRLSMFFDSNGSEAGMFATVRDIREEKRHLQEIVLAKEEAESANLAQNRLLTVISHELRTPLNPIIGYSDLLLSKTEDPMQVEFLNVIRNSASVITGLIDEILDYAKIESGDIGFEENPFRISELITLVVGNLKTLASGHGNTLDGFYEWKNCAVNGDMGRIRLILENLVSNACTYTKDGSVVLRCGIKSGNSNPAVFRFSVEDNGIGIASEQLASIFEPFKKSIQFPGVGVGLGLAVAKQLAVAMGGRISVKSEVGKGSTFHLDIPLTIVVTEEKTRPPVPDSIGRLTDGYRILVVEDDKANLAYARDLLQSFGCVVSVASDGAESLKVLEEQDFDLVLMDISMPIMNGHEATARIRKSNGVNRNVPVVAMTADATRKNQIACSQSGMSDFLAKPVSLEDFETVLSKWLVGEKVPG